MVATLLGNASFFQRFPQRIERFTMLIRKSALLASLLASLFGASNAEAGCFGKRNCCQATPIVCPPCAPAINMPQISYSQVYSYASQSMGSAITNNCGGCGPTYVPQVCYAEQSYTVSGSNSQGTALPSTVALESPTDANILLTDLKAKLELELLLIKQKLEKIQPQETTSLDTLLDEVKK